MPKLRDTEWRLLCVIIRQTFGWTPGGVAKSADWLSHSQLRRRTGRAGAAISLAVDHLCGNGLITVTDRHGRLLATSSDRRRNHGRLYFCLNPLLLSGEVLPARMKRRIRKAKTTINNQTIRKKNVVVVAGKRKALQPKVDQDERSQQVQAEWLRVGEILRTNYPKSIKRRKRSGKAGS